jgi:diguanylate cyclase (GGDEF)-like protein
MNRFLVSGCLVCLAIFPVTWSAAAPLVVGDAPRYRLGGHLELLSDTAGGMSLSQIMGGSAGWRFTEDSEPNLGFSTGVAWVRFQIESQTDHALLLVYQFANVDFVDVFVVHPDGREEHMASGNHVPFAERPVAHRYPVFPLSLARGQTAWCYVQLRNDDTLFPLSVWDESAFRNADHDEQMVIGLFGGLFIIVVLFNAAFYVATRDRAYLYYVMFVLSYVLFELAFRGIGGEYLWPRNTWIDDAVEVSAASLAITMGLCFALSFLQTRIWAPIMHRFLTALAVIGAVNTICTLIFPFTVMDEVTNLFLLASAVVLIPNAFIVLRRGYRAARFYLAAWVPILPGGIVFALFNLGLIPSTRFTMNALSYGATAETVLLFLAIVDRILLLRHESATLQRERLEAVEKRLYSDTLTELPNRSRLILDLQPGRAVTVAIVNIDHFREINDCFGQKAGDFVIRELGSRIRAAVAGRGGAVYRLHADEIAVVIDSAYGDEQLNELGRALTSGCQADPYLYENETLRLDVSIGIAVTHARHLEKVDMALNVARSRKTFVIYRPELEVIKRYADNLHWLHVIREAIDQDRIIPYFQPILNNTSGTIDKFESLMRIRENDGQIIPPGAFFTIAKKSKIYPELSRAIIQKTAVMMRGTERNVSINVSLEDIVNADVLEVIDRVVSGSGLGQRIVFELLESEGIENYAEVSRFIERMKSWGCKIAIDDFGTGYSNFEHILRLHVDYLKLDASLIKPIADDANARCIVETIVAFARKLGIQTIAEFVHNEAVQTIVRSIGVDHSQGYFISEPRPDMSFVLPVNPA